MNKKIKPKSKKYKRIYIRMLALSFILIIFIFGIFNALKPNKTFSNNENRILTQKPKISWQDILDGKFTKQYQKYIEDQFALRDFFIGVKSDVERLLGKKIINGVYLGEDGYLIQSFNAPKDEKMNEIINSFKSFANGEKEINKSIAIVPNAIELLRDKLPNNIPDKSQLDYINKLKDNLKGDYKFIDIYEELNQHKNEDIYYKTDHHWTTNGAYYGYSAIMKELGYNPAKKEDFNFEKISNDFYGTLYSKGGFRHIQPDSIDVYVPKDSNEFLVSYPEEDIKKATFYDLESLKNKDKYSIFFGGNHSVVKINSNSTNNKNLLVVKDSYANSLIPFLSKEFSKISMIDLRYFNGDIYEYIKENEITDIIFVYNANTFFEDSSLKNLVPLE